MQASSKHSTRRREAAIEEFESLDRLSVESGTRDLRRAIEISRQAMSIARELGDDDKEARCLLRMAYWHIMSNEMDEGRQCLMRAEKIVARGNTSAIRSVFLRLYWGYFHNGRGDLHSSITEYYAALELAGQVDNPLVSIDALNALGVGFLRLGDYARSLEFYLDIYDRLMDLDQPALSAINGCNIGTVYMKAEDPETAENHFRQALTMFEQADHKVGLAAAYANLGAARVKRQLFEAGLEDLARALSLNEELGRPSKVAWVHGAMGEGYIGLACYEQARQHLLLAMEIQQKLGNMRSWTYVVILLADLSRRQGLVADEIDLLIRAQTCAAEIGHLEYECGAWQRLSTAYGEAGRATEALEALQHYFALREAIHEDERRTAFVRAQIRYATSEIESERRRLRDENRRLEEEVEQKERTLTTLSMRLMHNHSHIGKIREQVGALTGHRDREVKILARDLLRRIDQDEQAEKALESFERRFAEIDQEYLSSIVERYPSLTRTEAKVCCLLRNDLNSKEIATLLCTSVRTVESHRRFIRKKLSLPKQTNLAAFLSML